MSSAHHFQDPLVGRVIDDRYEILERIGEGGMGVVYKARQTSIDRIVAIKVLNQQMAQSENWVKRFYNEAKACSQLQHPNTIRMFEFGQTRDSQLYMAMEFLDGKSLREVIAEGPMHPARVVKILIQCCASLAEAHAIGIIHRDIKPDNVFLISMPGSPDFVKLLDFSVAKLLQDSGGMRTQAGVVFGTPQYMSPEQGRGLPLDARSDLYALGILAYEMLSGKVPFTDDNPMMVLQMHLQQPVPPLPGNIPPDVQSIVTRALEKEPGNRYQSAGDMMQHCQQVFTQMNTYGPGAAAPKGPQVGGAVQMGGPPGSPPGQMGGPPPGQMGGPPPGGPPGGPPGQMGGPPGTPPGQAGGQAPRSSGFAPASDAAAKTIVASSPDEVQAMIQQQRERMQQQAPQPPSGAEAKTMIAGGGVQPPDLSNLNSMGGPAPGSGGYSPAPPTGQPAPPTGQPPADGDDGPPKTIMLQDTEGIVSLTQQQQAQPGPGEAAQPPASRTAEVDLEEEEGASLLYWVACLSGGLVTGVLAYLVIRLLS